MLRPNYRVVSSAVTISPISQRRKQQKYIIWLGCNKKTGCTTTLIYCRIILTCLDWLASMFQLWKGLFFSLVKQKQALNEKYMMVISSSSSWAMNLQEAWKVTSTSGNAAGTEFVWQGDLSFRHTPNTHTHTPHDTHTYSPRLARITYRSSGPNSKPIQHLGQRGKVFAAPCIHNVSRCRLLCVCVCAEALLGSEHDGEGEINNDIHRTSCSPVWLAALIKIG